MQEEVDNSESAGDNENPIREETKNLDYIAFSQREKDSPVKELESHHQIVGGHSVIDTRKVSILTDEKPKTTGCIEDQTEDMIGMGEAPRTIPGTTGLNFKGFNKFKEAVENRREENDQIETIEKSSPGKKTKPQRLQRNANKEMLVKSEKQSAKIPKTEEILSKSAAANEGCGNSNFVERMGFDIYRRSTKNARLEIKMNTPKTNMKSSKQDDLYQRLVNDAQRRNQIKKQIESFEEEEHASMNGNTKKLSQKIFNQIYERMMTQNEVKQIEIQRKKAVQEMINEYKTEKILEQGIAYHQKINKEGINNMLERFKKDDERRKKIVEAQKDLLEQKKLEEEKKYFKPKINRPKTTLAVSSSVSFSHFSEHKGDIEEKVKQVIEPKTISEVHKKAVRIERKEIENGKSASSRKSLTKLTSPGEKKAKLGVPVVKVKVDLR